MRAAPTTVVDLLDGLDNERNALTFVDPDGERRVSYAELGRRSLDTGRRIAALGFRPGDRLVLVVADQLEFVDLYFGCVRAGVVPVPVFPPYLLAQMSAYVDNLARVVRTSGATAVVTSDQLVDFLAGTGAAPRVLGYSAVRQAGDDRAPLPAVTPDDLLFLQFTSGSTAAPKGVRVTHASLLANARCIGEQVLGVDTDADRGVSWLPLYHDMGLIGFLFVPMLAQASTWYLPPLDFARSPASWCDWIDRVGATVSFAPNFAYGLLARRATPEQVERWDLSRWRVAGCGAEPIRPTTLRAFAERMAPAGFRPEAFLPCYGLAEATLAVTMTPCDLLPRTLHLADTTLRDKGVALVTTADDRDAVELQSCGRVLPGHQVRVVDDSGGDVDDLVQGEILVRGPSVTPGYHDDPEATAAAFRDGWLHTGDLGFTRDGELYVTGRRKDLVIVNGRNYHPQDIEWVAADEPGVRGGSAVAFAVDRGDAEALVVVVEPTRAAGAEHLADRVRRRVAGGVGLTPAEVVVVARDSLPKTTSGKLRRQETRRRYLDGELERADVTG